MLAEGDVRWIQEKHIPELLDAMVSDLLVRRPAEPVGHVHRWLLTRNRPIATPSGSRPQLRQNVAEAISIAHGDRKAEFAVLRKMSVCDTGVAVPARRMTLPNLTMRSLSLRQKYANDHPNFIKQLNTLFPGSLPEMDMIAKATKVLEQFGFQRGNAIPMMSVCRDELSRSLVDDMEELWGPSFSTGSIAAMVFCGKTGMLAGMGHAPQSPDGLERYIFVSVPHIAISREGVVGECVRPGRSAMSHACGALSAMLSELQSGTLKVTLDTHDIEQSMMKQQLAGLLKYGQVPSLEQLTKAAQVLIKSQVESTLEKLKPRKMEYAFISGVQVHGPNNANFFWPTDFYVQKADNTREDIDLNSLDDVDATDLLEQAYARDYARVAAMMEEGDMATVNRWIHPSDHHAILGKPRLPHK